jgi:hypothetical protein
MVDGSGGVYDLDYDDGDKEMGVSNKIPPYLSLVTAASDLLSHLQPLAGYPIHPFTASQPTSLFCFVASSSVKMHAHRGDTPLSP